MLMHPTIDTGTAYINGYVRLPPRTRTAPCIKHQLIRFYACSMVQPHVASALKFGANVDLTGMVE
jgi:hypothetical protein